ncbi:MAG: GDP-L-fucose synthase [Nitrospirae bacterium]|nr:GDP-L-fucose synthase [Nitrospirota bacterium]
MKKASKIYVAGHNGLAGSAIVRRLKQNGYSNIIVKTSKELDLRRQADTENFFDRERPEYVFLAAAKVGGIHANSTYKAEFIYDNMLIAANVVNSSYKYTVKKLLNLGSSCIYPKFAAQPLKEEYMLSGILEPTNEPYAVAKISAIKLCRYYNEQYGTNFISVMPTNLYGPNDNFNLETAHVLPAIIRKFHIAKLLLRQDFNVTLWGSGEPFREFLYVDDLADACVFLMENHDYRDIGEFINVGTGEDIQIKDLAVLVRRTVGFEGNIKYDLSRPDGTPKKLLDISKIKSMGWLPKTRLEAGIEINYRWYADEQ